MARRCELRSIRFNKENGIRDIYQFAVLGSEDADEVVEIRGVRFSSVPRLPGRRAAGLSGLMHGLHPSGQSIFSREEPFRFAILSVLAFAGAVVLAIAMGW